MKTLTRAALSVGAAVLVVGGSSGCAPEPRGSSLPSATLTSTPLPSLGALPAEADLTAWAEGILPENTPGGIVSALRTVGSLQADSPITTDVSQPAGLWEMAIGCESTDGAPASLDLMQDGASIATLQIPCVAADGATSAPDGTAVAGGPARVAFDGGHDSQVSLMSPSDAVFILQVYPGTPAAN